MPINTTADALPVAEAGVSPDQLAELAIHIGFNTYPVFFDPSDSASEQAMKKGPAFLRFPVQLSTKDAGMLEQLFDNTVAFVAFEIKDADGKPGYYRLFTCH